MGTLELESLPLLAVIIALVLLIDGVDSYIFRHMGAVSAHLDEPRLAVTEAVFGVLLAGMAGQLTIEVLVGLGIIHHAG